MEIQTEHTVNTIWGKDKMNTRRLIFECMHTNSMFTLRAMTIVSLCINIADRKYRHALTNSYAMSTFLSHITILPVPLKRVGP